MTIQYIEPVAATNMTVTHKMMLNTLIAKEKLRFGGFLTTSQIRLGSQKVVGANPIAPKKPMRSADSRHCCCAQLQARQSYLTGDKRLMHMSHIIFAHCKA